MQAASPSNKIVWTGRIISWVVAVALLLDAVTKVLRVRAVVEGTVQAGYPENTVAGIGLSLLVSTLLYLFPPTSIVERDPSDGLPWRCCRNQRSHQRPGAHLRACSCVRRRVGLGRALARGGMGTTETLA